MQIPPTSRPGRTKEDAGASDLPRLPAAELEAAVLEQLRGILRAPEMVAQVVGKAVELDATLDEAQVGRGGRKLVSSPSGETIPRRCDREPMRCN